MHVTIDPRPVQPVNHCFTTCTGRTSRTSRVKPFTGRIRSTVLDKDGNAPEKSRDFRETGPRTANIESSIYREILNIVIETK